VITDSQLRQTITEAMTEAGFIGAKEYIDTSRDDELLELIAQLVRASCSAETIESRRAGGRR